MWRMVSWVLCLSLPGAVLAASGDIRRTAEPWPDQYIVVLEPEAVRAPGDRSVARPGVPEVAHTLALAYQGELLHIYEHALRGFAIRMPEPRARQLAGDLRVAWVEEDGVARLDVTQTSTTWGIDRIDQRNRPLDSKYTYNRGAGNVHAYVIDSGIRASHKEFDVRVGNGFDGIGDGRGTGDCNGHGTHVAGTLGGVTFGVAKGVTLHPVRVFGCSDTTATSTVIAGVDWVTANRIKPAVANMSLGGSANSSLDSAVRNSISAGVVYVVSAGNRNSDACNFSPARVGEALTVGASNSSDARWVSSSTVGSNFGTCLDLFAPGQSITSAGISDDLATSTMTGTSMAAPHVAGTAALYLSAHTGADPSEVSQAILDHATTGRLSGIGSGSPNRLVHTGLEIAPVCSPCDGGTCTRSEGAYISHFTGLGCTGEEHYYTPYFNTDGVLRSWDGQGCLGDESSLKGVTNRSYRDWAGVCRDAWPDGNSLDGFVKVNRPSPCSCPESVCTPPTGSFISHFTGLDCTGEEYYYTPYNRNDASRRPWDGGGCPGTVLRTVTNRSYRNQAGSCFNAWPNGNTLSGFVRVYR